MTVGETVTANVQDLIDKISVAISGGGDVDAARDALREIVNAQREPGTPPPVAAKKARSGRVNGHATSGP